MKLLYLYICFIIIYLEFVFPRDFAYPINDGERSIGISQPLILGLKNKYELSTHPLLLIVFPNVKFKFFHGENKNIGISSRYTFNYPTPLLKLIQHRNYFAFISDDPNIGKIPNLLLIKSELIATKLLTNYSITGKLGISVCPGCNLDKRHLIDYDLAYPRMALYHHGFGSNIGLDWDYNISQRISLKTDIDLFFLPEENIFIEHKTIIHYIINNKYILSSGYKFCHGYYPFNKNEGLSNLFPIFDLSWKW